MPVPPGPCQPGHLDAQHDAHTPHRDLGDQPGKARTRIGGRGRYPKVVIDYHDLRPCPAQRRRPLHQRILQPRRFGMLKNLLPAGLADIHHRGPIAVLGADLLLRLTPRPVPAQAHRARLLPGRSPPGPPAAPAAPPPQPAAPPAAPSRPAAEEPPFTRRSVASGSPTAGFSRVTMATTCNSAPTLSIAPAPGATPENCTISGASQVAD